MPNRELGQVSGSTLISRKPTALAPVSVLRSKCCATRARNTLRTVSSAPIRSPGPASGSMLCPLCASPLETGSRDKYPQNNHCCHFPELVENPVHMAFVQPYRRLSRCPSVSVTTDLENLQCLGICEKTDHQPVRQSHTSTSRKTSRQVTYDEHQQ